MYAVYIVIVLLLFYTKSLVIIPVFATLTFTYFLAMVSFNSYIFTRDSFDLEKKKIDDELKQKQLELFYYPLLQLIEKSEIISKNLKIDARALYRYQYLIIEDNGNKIRTFFSNFESKTDDEISVDLKYLKEDVLNDIESVGKDPNCQNFGIFKHRQ